MDSTAGFRNLVVWQKAQQLAARVVGESTRLPKQQAAAILAAQLLRSAGSVSANIAEGYGRFSPGAYRNHLSIARGSLFETESWIDLMHSSGYLSDDTTQQLLVLCGDVGRLLTTMMKGIPANNPQRIRDVRAQYLTESAVEDWPDL
jgi:four helix bundle protein